MPWEPKPPSPRSPNATPADPRPEGHRVDRVRHPVCMIPPQCYVCQLSLWSEPEPAMDRFVLVHFGGHWENVLDGPGHPPNAFWFCTDHSRLALEREHLPYPTALTEIDVVIGRSPGTVDTGGM
jgi:hypothetical protein